MTLKETRDMTISLSANSAIKCALYPTKAQKTLLMRAFVERNRWYNIHVAWFRDAWRVPAEALRKWCEEHPGSGTDKALAAQRKAFASSLKWPSQTKMGWPKSVVHPNEKYLARFGQPVSIFWNAMNEAAEDDLGRAIKTTKSKGRVAFASPRIRTFTVPIPTKHDIEVVDEYGEVFDVRACYAEFRKSDDGVCRIRIPLVSPARRKEDPEIEWFRVKFSEKAMSQTIAQSAITVTMDGSGKFFASIRAVTPEKKHQETGLECGIDVGVRDAATVAVALSGSELNSGDEYFEANFDRKKVIDLEARIDHLRKLQSRRIKTWLRLNADGDAKGLTLHGRGRCNATAAYIKRHQSRAYSACERRIAALSRKIASIRKDFCEKLSRKVADIADTIGMEDLNVKGMVKNRRLSRAVSRIGFYELRSAVERKAKGRVKLADRFMPSSKTCSFCGGYNPDLKFEHQWICPRCGRLIERDRNAASNLRPSMWYASEDNMKKPAGQVAATVKPRTKRGGNTPGVVETRPRHTLNGHRRKPAAREEALNCEKPGSASAQADAGPGSVEKATCLTGVQGTLGFMSIKSEFF